MPYRSTVREYGRYATCNKMKRISAHCGTRVYYRRLHGGGSSDGSLQVRPANVPAAAFPAGAHDRRAALCLVLKGLPRRRRHAGKMSEVRELGPGYALRMPEVITANGTKLYPLKAHNMKEGVACNK